MTEQSEKYQKTLQDAREMDRKVDLVLDTTAEDVGLGGSGRSSRTPVLPVL